MSRLSFFHPDSFSELLEVNVFHLICHPDVCLMPSLQRGNLICVWMTGFDMVILLFVSAQRWGNISELGAPYKYLVCRLFKTPLPIPGLPLAESPRKSRPMIMATLTGVCQTFPCGGTVSLYVILYFSVSRHVEIFFSIARHTKLLFVVSRHTNIVQYLWHTKLLSIVSLYT
jgi:hypothetical protein